MPALLILLAIAAGAAWGAYQVRRRDRIAAALLLLTSVLAVAGLVASFLGWPAS